MNLEIQDDDRVIYYESRFQKSQCQIQAEKKESTSKPQCFCHLCKNINVNYVSFDKLVAPNLLVCPYREGYWLSMHFPCCCTTIHQNNRVCEQSIKANNVNFIIQCLCPRCCCLCMKNIVLDEKTLMKKDCSSCSRKYKLYIQCKHYRGYCRDNE